MNSFLLKKNLLKLFIKFNNKIYYKNIIKWSNSNLKNSIFFISFDIETQYDVDVLDELTKKLINIKIKPFYAVPAELIEKNIKIFKRLSKKCIIINHGYKIHTEYNKIDSSNFSTYSYSFFNHNVIEDDIIKGHDIISDLPNQNPNIFRAPHFGEFCEKNSLSKVYKILSKLSYRISSSTTPIFSLIQSPIYKVNDILEIPSSGYISNPLQIIDSWSIKQDKKLSYQLLSREIKRYCKIMEENKFILNVYFDPSDIIKEESFFDSVSKLSSYQLIDVGSIS